MSADLSTDAIADALAARLAKAKAKTPKRQGLPARPADALIVLSSAQRRLWFLDQLSPGGAAYTLPVAWRLRGPLDIARLRSSLVEVVASADALRTFYPAVDGVPTAVLSEAAAFEWREFEGLRAFDDEVRRPFDLAHAAPFRASLFRVGAEEHVLLLCVHHVAADGWSMGLIAERLSTAYGGGALVAGTQYADVAHWQQQRSTSEDLAYWREQLADSPRPVELPGDRVRPAHPSDAGAEYTFTFDEAATARLRSLATREGVSTFMCLVAAFQLLCARQTGIDDITVAAPVSGRDALPELRTVVGCLVETVLLRARTSPQLTGHELLQQVRNTVLEATEHSAAPFEDVAALLPYPAEGRPPYSVLFSATHVPRVELALQALEVESVPIAAPATKVDLTMEVADLGALTISATITYSTDLFNPETITRFATQYLRLLEGLATTPSSPVVTLPLLTPTERAELAAAPPEKRAGTVLDGFAETVRRAPNRVAVVAGDGTLTYSELDALSGSLALRLLAEGAGRESLVGLSAERTTRYAVGLLAILKSGAAYLPIEPTHPVARQSALLTTAGAALAVDLPHLPNITTLDAVGNHPPNRPSAELGMPIASDLAYVIFTSGSTGQPKGVAVEHGGLRAYVDAFAERLRPEDGASYAVLSTLAADLGHSMVFTALARGGTLQLIDADVAADPVALSKHFEQHPVDYLKIVPSHLAALIGSGGCLPRKALVLGGAACPWSLVDTVRRHEPGLRILNHYGPTETTVGVLAHEIPLEGERPSTVPLGTPLGHAAVHILDPYGEPQPVGVWGELCVRGPAVARGYLGGAAFEGRYATGDRARWLADGTIEFGGRLDRQVKIRGHRVEPGEIEGVLSTHPSVDATAVLVAEGNLHAYVGSTEQPGDLRGWLAERLPEHMVPATITVLSELPLNANGKVDQRALAAMSTPVAVASDRPLEGTTQHRVAGVFAELLGVTITSGDADFFELGGHSLLAIRAAARLRRDCGVAVVVRDLFDHRTIVALANHIDGLRRSDGPELVHREHQSTELSHGQQRYWFLDQVDPGNPVSNLPSAFKLKGRLDENALRRALEAVVDRHEILRTAYPSIDGQPRAVVLETAEIPLPTEDLRGDSSIRERIDDEFRRGFELATGPALRAKLLRTGEDEHILLLTVHHIASDGWSNTVLLEDLSKAYKGEALDRPPVTYADYTHWETEKDYQAERDFWRKELAGAPTSLDLPVDRSRPALPTHHGDAVWLDLDKELTDKLTALSRANDVTLFMTLLAAYQVVLARYAGVEDLVVGTAVAGREHPDLDRVVGMFVNSLPLRGQPKRDLPFLDYLHQVRRTVLDGFEHSAMPFDRLLTTLDVPRDPSRTPIFTTMFVLQNTPPAKLDLPGITVTPVDAATGVARTDLSLYLTEQDAGIHGALEYNTDILDRSTAQRLTGYLRTLLIAVAAQPETKLGDLPLSDAAERQLLAVWNTTDAETPSGLTPDWIIRQASLRPEAVAVQDDNEQLTYAELVGHSASLAKKLKDAGAGHGTIVGLALERSVRMSVAMLAVLRLGATYLPLDPEYPKDRLAYMVDDSGAAVLVTDGFTETFGLPTIDLREGLPAPQGSAVRAVVSPERAAPEADPAGSDPAYIIYTSGSTGRPKGVVIPHSALANLLTSFAAEPGLTEEDTVLAVASMSFDMSVKELLLPLTVGAKLVIGGRRLAADGEALARRISDTGTTYLQATPLTWQLLIETGWTGNPDLIAACGGEALPPELAVRLQGLVGELWNFYGPTETTVWSTRELITSSDITVGRPISNTSVHVLDDELRPVPLGAIGELCIGGAGVALGYHGKPELTKERFVPNPFGSGRIYRTGDLARRRPDGRIEVRGRADGQLKLRGYRIEVGEIETVLLGHPEIVSAAVAVRQDRLIGYVVGTSATDTELREHCRRTLPDYMLPATFVRLDELPTTPNGKIDRLSLPAPVTVANPSTEDATPAQRQILKVFSEVLGLEVGLDDGFFDLGGDSLRAVRTVRAIDPELSVLDLFRYPSARLLAEHLTGSTRSEADVLQKLTKLGAAEAELTVIGAPFGGGGAIVYADLAQRMPATWALYAIQPPGTDYSRPDEALIPLPELADRCAERILAEVPSPVLLYGHCVGSALAIAVAQRLEEAGKIPESITLAASFPNTRLPGVLGSIARLAPGRRQSDRMLTDTLRVLGGLGEDPPPAERAFVAKAIRHQADQGELFFTTSFTDDAPKLASPLRVVVGDLDEATRFASERVHDWDRFGEVVELHSLPGAGHFFHRDPRVAELLTKRQGRSRADLGLPEPDAPKPPKPPNRKANLPGFLTVTAGQFVSLIGAGLSTFALGVWAYQQTGRATALATIAAFAIVPVILTAPLAGAVADRWNRRRVMMACDLVALSAAAMLIILLAVDSLALWHLYVFVTVVAVTSSFRQPAYLAAVAQLVPKRYLGQANGLVGLGTAAALLFSQLLGGVLLLALNLSGVLWIDLATSVVALATLAVVKVPDLGFHVRDEPLLTEIAGGWSYLNERRGLLAVAAFFAIANGLGGVVVVVTTPMVLAFGSTATLGLVLAAQGAGLLLGGVLMAIWGGTPQRITGMIAGVGLIGLSSVVIGLRPTAFFPIAGMFGVGFCAALINAHWLALVQVKVPHELLGRVLATILMLARVVMPLGYLAAGPLVDKVFEPPMREGGGLARILGPVFGTGTGRGMAVVVAATGVLLLAWSVLGLASHALRTVEQQLPDAVED